MKRTFCLLSLTCGLGFAQHDVKHNHDAQLNQRGDEQMGFSHEKTTHHFALTQDGGSIEVRANDPRDTASQDQIRAHFAHIVQMFSAGNFNVPMLVHAQSVPGTAVMSQRKDQIHWKVQDIPRGAKIVIVADNKPARDAVHEFLRFQITDHKTGDSTAVH